MAKYFDSTVLQELNVARRQIFAIREAMYRKFKIDMLDTDALSSLSIHEIVNQYDSDYNINFSRNGEDAKSNGILIEQKATRVEGALTKTGKQRKGAGSDASFQFHAEGDLDHPRYIFVARNKDDLSVVRIYDISSPSNCQLVLDELLRGKTEWLAKGKKKRDIILVTEKFVKHQLTLPTTLTISGCTVFKD